MQNQECRLLVDSNEFISYLKKDIENAKKSIKMQFLTFEADNAGKPLAELLIKKARQGIKISFILDKFNDYMINDNIIYRPKAFLNKKTHMEFKETKKMLALMENEGIKIKKTGEKNPFLLKTILFTNHKKIVIIDGKIAYIGGFNLSDHNFSWHDLMVRLRNRIVPYLAQDFDYTWNGERKAYIRKISEEEGIISDSSSKEKSLIHGKMLDLIRSAKESIFIESPYFAGRELVNSILKKAEEGIKITIIMPKKNNRVYYRPLTKYYSHIFGKYKTIDYRLYYKTQGMLHTKIMVVDNKIVFFGSSNLSTASSLFCDEIMIFSKNNNFVSQAKKKVIEKDILSSRKDTEIISPLGWIVGILVTSVLPFFARILLKFVNRD